MSSSRPVFLLVVLAVTFFGWTLLPHPLANVPTDTPGPGVSTRLWSMVGPGLPVLALGAIACWSGVGFERLGSVTRYLCGREREGDPLHAHHGLAAAARSMVRGGLVLGLLGGAAVFLLVGQSVRDQEHPSPAELAYLISFSLLAPITALGVGRLVLGVSADAAALRAGLVGVRTFARRDDLLLLLFLLPPVLSFGAIMWPTPIVESVPR